ncbi:uncharacterized protein LOC132559983 [Ylistrum balloti]|uniref:uncharacterized protein LOC132559983 n=1 Tax=Ylistrum balloti TaxID=509963 RepID=UPI0029058E35|nr:uncharacterized protein LOC132559983 [Ylistrum balloti]
MNTQYDILLLVIFVLSTLINSSGAFGWYDGYKYNIFSKPQTSENTDADSPAILSLWSKYHFLRHRRASVDGKIFRPSGLYMKRFLHYSPLIFMKNKNTKSSTSKLKTIRRKHEKNVYRPFNAFGIFINTFKPSKTGSIEKDPDFSESVPEVETADNFDLQRQEIPSLEDSLLSEQSRVVPNLSEIENVETIRPNLPLSNKEVIDIASNEDEDTGDTNISQENQFGIVPSQGTTDEGDGFFGFGTRHHSSTRLHVIPTTDDTGNIFSHQKQHGAKNPSKETAKNLNLPQIILDPIHQRASVSDGLEQKQHGQVGFVDQFENQDRNSFEGFPEDPVAKFGTEFHDNFQDSQNDYGTFRDIINDDSDFSNEGHFPRISEGIGFSDNDEFFDQNRFTDKALLSQTGSSFDESFSPYQNIDNFYNEEFGGGFENFENLDSSDIAGGEFFNDGNDFEGFFDTDESGCEGIQTRSCSADVQCSCLGLYFCIEGTCGMKAALPNRDHGDSTQMEGTWLDIPPQFR